MIRLNVRDRLRRLIERARTDDYQEFFLAMMEDPDEERPAEMVGRPEQWEVHGHWQLGYARRLGLQPEHRLLDVGCGPLRFGLRAIPYLEAEGYAGFDISQAAIETAMELVREAGLEDRKPTLFCNQGYDVYSNGSFDVVWAQSVLTHVPPDEVEAFLAMVENNLDAEGWAMVTFRAAVTIEENPKATGYRYPVGWIEERLPDGLEIEAVDREAGHPRGQDVMILAREESLEDRGSRPAASRAGRPPT